MSCYFGLSFGRYNMCSNEKEWQLYMYLPDGAPQKSIGAIFKDGQEPDIGGATPMEIIDIIVNRWGEFIYRSGQNKDDATVEWCRANSDILNREWAEREIKSVNDQIERLNERKDALLDYLPEPSNAR